MIDNTNFTEKKKHYFICPNSSVIIDIFLVNDLVSDCGPEGEDEPALIALLKFKKAVPCSLPSEIPCLKGHPKCF